MRKIAILLAVVLLVQPARAADAPPAPRIGALPAARVLFLGNSITLHAPKRDIGWTANWGMAASAERFTPCRNVLVKGNRVVFRRAQVQTEINIGGGTEAATFRFESNHWIAEDRPDSSKPNLPTAEKGGVHGTDPRKNPPPSQ